tara:strand:+ start:7388 stop:9061 length:1674 start_codon:yes stop_codon:yes gene_type:complete
MENNSINKNNELENEIDFSEIIQTLIRRKSIIAIFGLISIIISVTAALSAKRIWEGNFQIVIDSNKDLVNSFDSSRLSQFINISNNELKTEVEILRSPLLLNKIYQYVLKQKKISKEDLLYKNWRDGIKIELKRNSSVLDISYRDSDKDLILSTLQKISNSYQEYSNQARLRNLDLGLEYFKNQIDLFKNKSAESIEKVQEFANEHDFNFFIGNQNNDKEKGDIYQKINVEVNRINSANKLRIIDAQLQQINNLEKDSDFVKFLSKPILDNILDNEMNNMLDELLNVEKELIIAKTVYKANDKSIKKLENKKGILISALRNETINFLQTKKYAEEINLKKSKRSKEILIKYRQLITEAEKDLKTYDKLIESYTQLQLERARYKDPWRLISNPTLLDIPVAPQRKKMVLISFISSLIVGSGVAYFDEKKRKVIYSLKEMIRISKWKLITNLSFDYKSEFKEVFQIIQIGFFANLKGNVAIIIAGKIEKEKINLIIKNLNKFSNQLSFVLENDFIKLTQFENILVLTELGVTKSNDLDIINSKCESINKSITGFINLSN